MADLFSECLAFTLAAEGGYVDDPYDPGGATNMGITLVTLRHWEHDSALGPEAVQDMSRQTASAIYGALYWNAIRGDSLPAGVDLSVFDFGVNAGTCCSSRLLQSALGFDEAEEDGCIGKLTLAAVLKSEPARLVDSLAERQAAYYRALPEFGRFGDGWLARTERRRVAAHAMIGASPAA
jgi:lysozyme family protein